MALGSSPVVAYEVSQYLIRQTARHVQTSQIQHEVYYSKALELYDVWSFSARAKQVQNADPNLGVRLSMACAEALQRYDQLILIGTDCPELDHKLLQEAVDQLNEMDYVLGPAADGGFYLLGFGEQWKPSIFEAIEWGSEQVLQQLINNISSTEKNYTLLKILNDIDTYEDWKSYSLGKRDGNSKKELLEIKIKSKS